MSALSQELCALRKERKLSIQDIYEKTRIDVHTIEAIEDGSIFQQHEKGTPYLRSFIRTYAKAVNVADEDIVKALDDEEIGEYDGLISKKYLNSPVSSSKSTTPKKPASGQESDSKPKLSLRRGSTQTADSGQASPQAKAASSSPEPSEKEDDLKRTRATSSIDIPDELDQPDPNRPHNQTITDRPNVTNVDWADTVKKAEPTNKRSFLSLGIVAAVIILVGIGSALYFGAGPLGSIGATLSDVADNTPSEEPETPDTEGIPTLPDTLVDEDITDEEREELSEAAQETDEVIDAEPDISEPTTLPDTLQLVIVAADGVLEPVRVRSDTDDTLRPYWVELGNGITIDFVDQLEFRGQFNRIGVLFNGHPMENFMDYLNEDGFVELTRGTFQEDERFTEPADEDDYEDIILPGNIEEVTLN